MTVHCLTSKCGGGGAMRRKTALLLGLLLTFALALPVQSQTPTAGPCGLPSSRTTWTSSTAQTTWNMTSDCTFSTSGNYYLRINSGSFIVNGNGYTIYSAPEARAFHIASGASLEIRNVTIRGLNDASKEVIRAYGNLTARDVTIRNNTSRTAIEIAGAVQGTLTNMRFLNNTGSAGGAASALSVNVGATVTLNNAIITGNSGGGNNYVVAVYASASTLTVTGCFTMSGNTGSNSIVRHNNEGTLNNNSIGACVGGGFTTATPTPGPGTATAVAAETATAEAAGTSTAEAEMTATAAAAETATAEAEGTATAAVAIPGTATAAAAAAGTATAEAEGTATAVAAETATVVAMTATATPTPTLTPMPRPRKKEKKSLPPTPTATPRPAYAASYTALQTETGMTFEAAYGLDSGVHFRQLDGGGIGIQSIIDAGPLAALDVYGYVEQGVEVCFPQIGRVIFLDARTMPRAITTLPATVKNGMTCVYLNSPGSLVLLPN